MKKRINCKRILKIAVCDILGYAVFMGTFLALFYLMPYNLEGEGTVVGDTQELKYFDLPEGATNIAFEGNITDNSKDEAISGVNSDDESEESGRDKGNNRGPGGGSSHSDRGNDHDNIGTDDISGSKEEVEEMESADVSEEVIDEYSTENVYMMLSKKSVGTGSDTITYYVADVYVSSLEYFKTALAENQYGTNIKDDVDDIAADNNAILAITGDSYGNNSTGIVVRNGILYRDDENDADVCLLYSDGIMKTYTADEFDEESVREENVWQAWCFGPSLLDENGDVLTEFTTTSYLSGAHPRVAIGYAEPGHYILMVVDGRDEGYSKGATLSELAVMMKKEGCVVAYNLDGGGSSSMYYDGQYINNATGREISDIIFIPEG